MSRAAAERPSKFRRFWRVTMREGLLRQHGCGEAWLVPAPILEAVHIVAHLVARPPARTAAALARLPLAPALRVHLRRLTAPPPDHQLPLF